MKKTTNSSISTFAPLEVLYAPHHRWAEWNFQLQAFMVDIMQSTTKIQHIQKLKTRRSSAPVFELGWSFTTSVLWRFLILAFIATNLTQKQCAVVFSVAQRCRWLTWCAGGLQPLLMVFWKYNSFTFVCSLPYCTPNASDHIHAPISKQHSIYSVKNIVDIIGRHCFVVDWGFRN